jgi:hypothetical protein
VDSAGSSATLGYAILDPRTVAKLLCRDFGERIGNLAASGEYHWFAPAFLRLDGPKTVNDLPIDAHELLALAAPRPIFIGAGNFQSDDWGDPTGSYLAAKAASPAYELLGVAGLAGSGEPGIDETRATGRIAFRQQHGGHSNELNWPAFSTTRRASGTGLSVGKWLRPGGED